MNLLFAKFAAAMVVPFLMFTSFMGNGSTTTQAPWFATSTEATSTGDQQNNGNHWGWWINGFLGNHNKDTDNDGDNDNSTTTPATTTPQTSVHISAIDPATGPIGTQVTLTGTGFSSDSIVHFGIGAFKAASTSDGTSISFAVPSYVGPYCHPGTPCPMWASRIVVPGTYNVSVTTGTSTSNAVKFHVTATSTSDTTHISVNGVDAPVTLAVGAEGTWTVKASTNATSTLHYSVVWGDEDQMAAMRAAAVADTQTSATFTHTYDVAGTYSPKFTVSDDNGHSASVSATVHVAASSTGTTSPTVAKAKSVKSPFTFKAFEKFFHKDR